MGKVKKIITIVEISSLNKSISSLNLTIIKLYDYQELFKRNNSLQTYKEKIVTPIFFIHRLCADVVVFVELVGWAEAITQARSSSGGRPIY